MRIYTRFFDNWRCMKPMRITAVSVTPKRPAGISGITVLPTLFPTKECYAAPRGTHQRPCSPNDQRRHKDPIASIDSIASMTPTTLHAKRHAPTFSACGGSAAANRPYGIYRFYGIYDPMPQAK